MAFFILTGKHGALRPPPSGNGSSAVRRPDRALSGIYRAGEGRNRMIRGEAPGSRCIFTDIRQNSGQKNAVMLCFTGEGTIGSV